jgi:cysteine desulfurase
MIYFDHNATAPVIREAREAWLQATENLGGNPSSLHQPGAAAALALDHARETLAALLGCDPGDLIWTSGATEANNTVLHHFAHTLGLDGRIFVSAIEHPCVADSARHYSGGRVKTIPVTRDGVVDLDWLTKEMAQEPPGLVAVMAANNETGVLQPWREIFKLCRAYDVAYFTDAVQFLGKLPAKGLGGCDYVSGAAHKFGGPRGAGFLKIPRGSRVTPLLLGGKQEGGRRAGTENVPAIAAMLAALAVREQQLTRGEHHPRQAWRDHFEAQFLRAIPGAIILGQNQPRLWNTVSVLMPEGDRKSQWVMRLDRAGFAVSTGSACTAGKDEPSHVLAAMGCPAAAARRALRFSAGWETTEADWDSLFRATVQVYGEAQRERTNVGL